MPELPEVEAVCRKLQNEIPGRRIAEEIWEPSYVPYRPAD